MIPHELLRDTKYSRSVGRKNQVVDFEALGSDGLRTQQSFSSCEVFDLMKNSLLARILRLLVFSFICIDESINVQKFIYLSLDLCFALSDREQAHWFADPLNIG